MGYATKIVRVNQSPPMVKTPEEDTPLERAGDLGLEHSVRGLISLLTRLSTQRLHWRGAHGGLRCPPEQPELFLLPPDSHEPSGGLYASRGS